MVDQKIVDEKENQGLADGAIRSDRAIRWKVKPGGWDSLNTTRLFPSSNSLGIPDLSPAPLSAVPERLIPYRARLTGTFDPKAVGVHFWLDDYRFETVWNRPQKAFQALTRFRILITPDFSIYRDWPRAVQIFNIYRNRWCGRLWHEAGYIVIPAVSWGVADTFDFCFLGLPRRSVLAVSRLGVDLKDRTSHRLFMNGFREMVERLDPTTVVAYGHLPPEAEALVSVVTYPTPHWGNTWHSAPSDTDG